MRHAPFFGWIKDLSAPDPTSILNFFGLLPWDAPSFLMIGVWPLLMGISMWLQMRLNPQQPGTPQIIFHLLPIVFTFTLSSFPAGLVIYWTWNNTLSLTQQAIIMRRHGVPVDLLGNIRASFRRKSKSANANVKTK
jgi:YidC/Oxa1 family membrane protein insertase